jgi:hypothetical protein
MLSAVAGVGDGGRSRCRPQRQERAAEYWRRICQVLTKYRNLFYLFLLLYFPDTSPIPYRWRIGVSPYPIRIAIPVRQFRDVLLQKHHIVTSCCKNKR